ncbi:MAG: DUF937 domain-containing protein [Actinomycetota bacterium]|jgi:hypothetical protein|nr:DUF937 domain-containing protein [Actinomycetota bacterium]
MASIVESVLGMLSGDTLGKISQQVGIPEDKTKQAIPGVMAVLTGALAKNAAKPEGASELANALAKDHDGSLLNNMSDYISHYKEGDGEGILKHVLGNNRSTVEKGLSQKTGLDMGSIGNLLTMAAPILMGALGKTQRTQGLDVGSLSNLLGQESNQAQGISGMGDILGQILGGLTQGQGAQQPQQTQQTSAPATTKKRSGCATVMIVLVIAVVVFFVLRSCGIL